MIEAAFNKVMGASVQDATMHARFAALVQWNVQETGEKSAFDCRLSRLQLFFSSATTSRCGPAARERHSCKVFNSISINEIGIEPVQIRIFWLLTTLDRRQASSRTGIMALG
jgi:hypothetical protein